VGPYTAIVDGDARVYSIACASVVAKVVRDRMMGRLAVRYPAYGWERNQGYATKEHRDAIREHGLTPHHRSSWQALQVLLAGDQLALFDAPDGNAAGIPLDAVGVMGGETDEADLLTAEALAAIG
jgi:ribonuclease HII